MFNVRSGKIGFLLLTFILISVAGFSQIGRKFHHFDIRRFNLGFTMGLNYAGYDMTNQIDQKDPSTGAFLKNVELVRKPGIYLGLVTNLKLHNNFDLRLLPSVSLEQRDFDFFFDPTTTINNESVIRKKIEASNLNIPLVVKFKSNYYNNVRVYVQGGLQASINLNSNKKVLNDPDLLKTQTTDIAYVASFGVDLYGERLKLSPEIRFTRGIFNSYVPIRTRFPAAISDLFSQSLVFIINFE